MRDEGNNIKSDVLRKIGPINGKFMGEDEYT